MKPKRTEAPNRVTQDAIADAGLALLNEVGLQGLTMRKIADRLGVAPPALYWHIENKQELLDAMATVMFRRAMVGLEAPRKGESFDDWAADWARRLRTSLLRYRDGGRVFAGTAIADDLMYRTVELFLRALQDAGFAPREAARGAHLLLHYTTGFVIEEQASKGLDYDGGNPYAADATDGLRNKVDAQRYPLMAQVLDDLFVYDPTASFEHGLSVILAGLRSLAPRRSHP
ncbi:TetR/AcrR family transcriptional regulator C-terminal domain-containing protein [Mycobacterium sp. Aquia_216]|uniref:TetR/AcrR family transcriptional regulator C-terminal domain-containing protein n=1 Tax=Mycobacterium sp. Aquia_216 TaxID=2991729 RepID=UPI00227C6E67|nr:TetR/AcrR family transcriptional regulator C-terminal domain-containing protein [Mycobacterium sp. Aquia_216]WAJ46229.1 TetR/AcrR family transcriptional regulator C-terminal domain-containing protein [Mycobacterium sp. Aquia_216]